MTTKIVKRSKFNVNMTKKGIKERKFDGISFDSLLELNYYKDVLIPLKKKGIVTEIILQPKYLLQEKFKYNGEGIREINYVADFEVRYADGRIEVIDTKGLPTEEAKLKRKLYMYKYQNQKLLWLVFSKQDGGWIEYDDYVKFVAERKRLKKLQQTIKEL